ncbi:hypothetical protein BH23GEM4_BH23GEM4_00540 [soil metagenome]
MLSSDPAHSLADALDRPLGPEPEEVAPLLWAQEVDLYYSMRKHWSNMRDLLLTVFRWQGIERVAAEVLSDPEVTSVRLVANPEKMVIEEARRAYTYLQLYGYPVDGVVVNRVLPAAASDGVFARYVQAQERYLEEISTSFSPLPIWKVPHLGEEVFGLPLLQRIAGELYDGGDPTDVFHREPTFAVEREGDGYLLRIRLPFLEADDVAATHRGDQLVVHVRNQRRNYVLPKFLAYYRLTQTRVEDGWLRVHFAAGE